MTIRMAVAAVAAALAMGQGRCRAQAAGPSAAEDRERAAAIQRTLAAVNAELAAHGGTFEAWAEGLRDYRADMAEAVATRTAAKGGFQFQGQSMWVLRTDDLDAQGEGYRPFDAITAFDRQCKARGIDLILAIIPSKLCVYPDYLMAAPDRPARAPADRQVAVCVKRLYKKLLEADVEVVDLYSAFQEARRQTGDTVRYAYALDSHWMNAGARVAADAIAERLARYGFSRAALARGNPFTVTKARRDDAAKADPDLHVVGTADGKPYWDVESSPVIVTGDSYSKYNWTQERPAHLSAQIALRIGLPVTLVAHSGLSADMPTELARLAREQDYLRGRRVIVWTFNDKLIPTDGGKRTWSMADLPAGAGDAREPAAPPAPAAGGAAVPTVAASAEVVEASAPPPKDAPYPHYFMLAHVRNLKGGDGKTIGDGEGVLHVLAMHRRKVLAAAGMKAGDALRFQLAPWSAVEKLYGSFQRGSLSNVQVEIDCPHYLAEMPGAPALDAEDLKRAGEE